MSRPTGTTPLILIIAFIGALLIGEGMAVVKCVRSDWKPSYKREIVYGVSALTGFGIIVGWMNIPDTVE